jgi:phage terminase large subunit
MNEFSIFLERYRHNPALFMEEMLGLQADEWQKEVLQRVADPGCRRIAIKAGHGVGKTACASVALIWFILTRYPCKAVCTAPTSGQLTNGLWPELVHNISNLPESLKGLLDVTSERVRLKADPAGAFISAAVARAESPEALAGVHSDHVLLIVDESSAVPRAVFSSSGGSMAGGDATMLLLGNPTRTDGLFFDIFNQELEDWHRMTVPCSASGRDLSAFIREIASLYGEDSSEFRIRCLGEFPLSQEEGLIPLGLVESAVNRDVEPSLGPVVMGVDIARFGGDSSAAVVRQGNTVLRIDQWAGFDLMQSTGKILELLEELEAEDLDVEEVLIDSVGYGAACVDRLRELEPGPEILGINVSESPPLGSSAANLRAELWIQARKWLEGLDVRLPKDRRLIQELSTPLYSYTSSGKIRLEAKDAIRKRLGNRRSPDVADAFVLTFAGSAATVSSSRSSWTAPLSRRLSVV